MLPNVRTNNVPEAGCSNNQQSDDGRVAMQNMEPGSSAEQSDTNQQNQRSENEADVSEDITPIEEDTV